jgi:hypothetical protein
VRPKWIAGGAVLPRPAADPLGIPVKHLVEQAHRAGVRDPAGNPVAV